jgi:hypothetical protein
MIKSVTAINHLGEALKLVLSNPGATGIKVTGITGLGPPKGTINTSKVSTVDGVIYNSATVGGRNIVLSTELLNKPTVEEVRLQTYRYFPIKKPVTLIFETETRLAAIVGYTESNTPELFGEDPTAQISFICPEAYFHDVSDDAILETEFYSVKPNFEFPFSNESLTQKLIEFGKLETKLDRDIIYTGETEVGMTITLHALGDVGNVVIYNPKTNEAMRINSAKFKSITGTVMTTGDVVVITTTRGNKAISLRRNGVLYNIRNALERSSSWLQLNKGANTLAYDASFGASNLQITIESQILYEGL